ncbi:hypothetical protein HPP92_005218 [Vanilla planifolia]|uniref:Protein EARLY FLOWERING 3-like n=1 Tax=Vanilla planifolia TaxID=51239 RepID=A0A835RP81_VANPL|nr:hypothetical protein HPP92_005218 [Vanilla planifolia]
MLICEASASDILSKRHEGNHVEHMPREVIVCKEYRKKNSINLEGSGMLPGPASDILSKRHVGNHVEHMPGEVIVLQEHRKQNSTNLEDAGMLSGSSKLFLATSGGVTEANTSLLEKLGHQNTRIDTEMSQVRTSRELGSLNNQDFLENRKTSKLKQNTSSGTSLGNSHGSHDYKENVSGELRDADRSDIVSEDSMVDSISVLEISPDDVVGVIGPKQFWKARRAIVNQQRVFAIQVFELHRLIKVQKLFAASPHLLLDDTSTIKIQPNLANKSPPVASNNFQTIAQQNMVSLRSLTIMMINHWKRQLTRFLSKPSRKEVLTKNLANFRYICLIPETFTQSLRLLITDKTLGVSTLQING